MLPSVNEYANEYLEDPLGWDERSRKMAYGDDCPEPSRGEVEDFCHQMEKQAALAEERIQHAEGELAIGRTLLDAARAALAAVKERQNQGQAKVAR